VLWILADEAAYRRVVAVGAVEVESALGVALSSRVGVGILD